MYKRTLITLKAKNQKGNTVMSKILNKLLRSLAATAATMPAAITYLQEKKAPIHEMYVIHFLDDSSYGSFWI